MTTDTATLATVDTDTVSRWTDRGGRVLYALPFGVFGLFHLLGAQDMAGMVPAWVPGGGTLWVVLTGIAMIAAAISLATGRLARVAGPLLALLMGVFVVTLHAPALGDPQMGQMAMISLLKDLALAGGALVIGARAR